MSQSENSDGKYRCRCGAFWPCICDKALSILGVNTRNVMKFDKKNNRLTAAEVECPRCRNTVEIVIDGNDVTGESKGADDEFWTVDEAGFPPTGECCELVFVIQPMGELECFDLRETEKEHEQS